MNAQSPFRKNVSRPTLLMSAMVTLGTSKTMAIAPFIAAQTGAK
jgi:hypothetical protein